MTDKTQALGEKEPRAFCFPGDVDSGTGYSAPGPANGGHRWRWWPDVRWGRGVRICPAGCHRSAHKGRGPARPRCGARFFLRWTASRPGVAVVPAPGRPGGRHHPGATPGRTGRVPPRPVRMGEVCQQHGGGVARGEPARRRAGSPSPPSPDPTAPSILGCRLRGWRPGRTAAGGRPTGARGGETGLPRGTPRGSPVSGLAEPLRRALLRFDMGLAMGRKCTR